MATPTARAAAAKKGARTRVYNTQVKAATAVREKHEANHPERYSGLEDKPGFTTHADTYRSMGLGVHDEPGQTSHGQQNLPGLDHPAVVNAPPRWEDMAPAHRERVTRNMAKFGVTHESAVKALGAQVDQAAMYEGQHGGGKHRSFYAAEGHQPDGAMHPRTRLITSAKENGVPFEQQAVANAITSPKNHFAKTPKSGANAGRLVYPNDAQATSAIRQAGEGKAIKDIRADTGMGGMHGNSQKAAAAVRSMQGGKTAAESWHAGPKTGPYHNSWADPHGPSQFWTSDIHSGGGGIAPHLSVTEREQMLNVAGAHSFNDHVARTVAKQRGIQSISGMQSMQWSQERRNRGLQGDDAPATKAGPAPHPQVPGQQHLF